MAGERTKLKAAIDEIKSEIENAEWLDTATVLCSFSIAEAKALLGVARRALADTADGGEGRGDDQR